MRQRGKTGEWTVGQDQTPRHREWNITMNSRGFQHRRKSLISKGEGGLESSMMVGIRRSRSSMTSPVAITLPISAQRWDCLTPVVEKDSLSNGTTGIPYSTRGT